MESYAWGVLAAFLLGFARLSAVLIALRSKKGKNLRKVGLHLNFITGHFEEKPNTFTSFLLYVAGLLILKPLLSWAYIATFASGKIKPRKRADKIRTDFLYQFERKELTKEEVISALNAYSQSPYPDQAQLVAEFSNSTSLLNGEPEHDYDRRSFYEKGSHTLVNPANRTLTIKSRSEDYISEKEFVFEFRLTDGDVQWRQVAYSSGDYGKLQPFIQNNVVLEDVIRKHFSGGYMRAEAIEALIQSWKSGTEWQRMPFGPLKMWLMKDHAGMSLIDYRRNLQLEKIRLEEGGLKAVHDLTIAGIAIDKTEQMALTYKYKDGLTDEQKEAASDMLTDEYLKKYNISRDELDAFIGMSKRIEKTLNLSAAA